MSEARESRRRRARRSISDSLAETPLIVRCAVVGWACVWAISVPLVAAIDATEYSLGNVVQAVLFGIVEAGVAAAVIGGGLGLLLGLLACLARGVLRRARRLSRPRPTS